MEEMGRAITTVRSSGAHLMLIVQSLANLREVYGADGAANFMGNCELQLFMAPTDADTPRYISEAIGDQTRMVRVKSWRQRGWDAASIQERQEGIRLIRPEQIRMLGPDAAIALVRDQNPVRVSKVRYYEDRVLRVLYKGQNGLRPRQELAILPKTPLPGGNTDEQVASRAEPARGSEPSPVFQAEPAMKASVAWNSGSFEGGREVPKSAVAAHRDWERQRGAAWAAPVECPSEQEGRP